MKGSLITIFVSILLFSACQKAVPANSEVLDLMAKELDLQPGKIKANAYLDTLTAFVSRDELNPLEKKKYLTSAVAVAQKFEEFARIPSFLLPLMRENIADEERMSLLPSLSLSLRRMNKSHAANAVDLAMMKQGKPASEELKESGVDSLTIEQYMQRMFDAILVDVDETGVNRNASMRYVDASEAIALAVPDDKKVPEYLYKSAEIARSIRTLPKAMSLYDWIIDQYPNYVDIPKVLFIKAYLIEYEYGDIEEARKLYEAFLKKYPSHEFAKSAEFLLKNLGKSEEEILKEIVPNQ